MFSSDNHKNSVWLHIKWNLQLCKIKQYAYIVNVYAKFNLFKKKNIGLLGYRKYLYNMKYDIYQRKFNDGCHVNQEGGEKMKASTITCLLMLYYMYKSK